MFFFQLILVFFCGLYWWQPWFGRPPPPQLDKMASPQPPLRSKYRMTLILQNTDTNMKYENIRIQILNILIYTKGTDKDRWTSRGFEILHDYKLFRIWSQISRFFCLDFLSLILITVMSRSILFWGFFDHLICCRNDKLYYQIKS